MLLWLLFKKSCLAGVVITFSSVYFRCLRNKLYSYFKSSIVERLGGGFKLNEKLC
jgi:hypothetical protein